MKWKSWKNAEKRRKKSVDDLLSSSQDVINQAISLTTSKDSKLKRSPSPAARKTHKRDPSDASSILSAEYVEVESRTSTDGTSPSPEITSKSQDDLKDSKKSSSSSSSGSKLAERAKKKAWYNVIYPSYKSRSEDYKKLFTTVPEDERLVVGKEKVAKVIPNAILITTENEKHFLTSFTSRDKAYVILFRLWQNALMDKPMNPQELWQSVHNCYGEQLGLTSDDEDYIDPSDTKLSAESVSEEPEAKASSSSSGKYSDKIAKKELKKEHKKTKKSSSSSTSTSSAAKESIREIPPQSIDNASTSTAELLKSNNKSPELCPTDMSDSTDSESGTKMDFINDAECNSMHEGRQLVHTILPINIETVFGLLFHKSKFFTEFHKMRKTTDLKQGEWDDMPEGLKQRIISLTVAITQVVGPKSSHVTETQVMRSCSKPGQLYSIDATSVNAGIPYADSFYVLLHYCMKRTVDDSTVMSVHAQIKYKKPVWGVIKGFIEKNTWLGLEDFYEALSKALMIEYCLPPAKAKSRRSRKNVSSPQEIASGSQPAILTKHHEGVDSIKATIRHASGHGMGQALTEDGTGSLLRNIRQERLSWVVIVLLVALIAFNVILYVKLWKLDSYHDDDNIGNKLEFLRNQPKSPEEWLKLLQLQEQLHTKEMKTWQKVIQMAIDLLRKTEQSLSELQNMILTHRSKSSADRLASVSDFFTDDGS